MQVFNSLFSKLNIIPISRISKNLLKRTFPKYKKSYSKRQSSFSENTPECSFLLILMLGVFLLFIPQYILCKFKSESPVSAVVNVHEVLNFHEVLSPHIWM